MNWTEPIPYAIGAYFGLGLLAGPIALFVLAPRSDPALAGSGKSVRLLLLPGAIAVWPIALWRWGVRPGGAR